MPRRRSASPRASAPVRSMRSSPPPASRVPATRAAPPHAGAPPSGGPAKSGLMGQMAATAGGVAIGSALGHAMGNMFSGGGSAPENQAAGQDQPTAAYDNGGAHGQQQQRELYSKPCEFEWQQFIQCTQNQSDVGVCQSFSEIFKDCKTRYASSHQQQQ